jgi:hypothetical protein
MTKRGLLLWVVTVALLTSAMPGWAAPGNTPAGPKAGNISALLPVAKITRGSGRKAVTTEAKKGEELVWNDLIQTEKGGRARITLTDQSILSLGSQSSLRIVKHDARSQQTALEMAYGRVRAQVASITRNGGRFELRTPTAVAGVIGTDFGVDSSSLGGDTFVCIAGAVQVSNSNKSVAGSVQCSAGQTTTVMPGKPPTPPQPASPQQIQQLIADTEPAIIASLTPASSLPGSTFDGTIAGQKLGTVNNVLVTGTGVTVALTNAADTGVQVHIVVDANAEPGPRTITLTKPSGASSAAVFTVLGPPSADQKTSYLTTLQELTNTGLAGLGGLVTGAQQSADQIAQSVTNANLNLKKPIDLTAFANALNQNYTQLQTDLQNQNTTIQTVAQNASTQFGTAYDTAHEALLARNASGTPDDTFVKAVTDAFQQSNTQIQTAINTAQNELNSRLQAYGNTLNELQIDWFTTINAASAGGPAPRVNALERDVDLGADASFDASGSSGTSGASIASTSWVLCAPSYQPNGFGTPLDPSTPACTPMQGTGFASNQAQFDIPTCSLTPGAYYARLTLTDTNGKVTPMDVKLVVNAPSYGTPTQTLQGLATAYQGLQYSPYASYFDQNAPGIATYLNNVQSTLPNLNSMTVHIISSQDTVTCNDASTYATWQLNYSYKNSPSSLLETEQPLQLAMHRVPGQGWLITNIVAQNGLQQGVIAGPLNTNAALPDLEVTAVSLDSVMLDPNVSAPVSSGISHTVQVSIANTGSADLTTAMPVAVTLLNGGNAIATAMVSLPALAQGATSTLMATLNLPQLTDGTKLTLQANVNPGCSLPEKACDSKNLQTLPITIQNQPDLAFGSIQLLPIQLGGSYTINVPVVNNGGAAPAGWTLVASVAGQSVTVMGPAVPGLGNVSVPVTFTLPSTGTPPQDMTVPLTLTISGVAKEVITNNNTFSGNVRLVDFALSVSSGTQTGVVGRAFSLTATSVAPSPYPIQLAVTYANLPPGLTANGFVISGTPAAAGTSSVTASGTADGVTHAASGSFSLNIQPEISLVQSTTPALVAGDPSQNLTIAVAGGIYPVTVSITLPAGITTTMGTISGNVSTQTLTGPGNVTWDLKADYTANTGSLTIPVLATDAGVAATATPPGNVPLSAKYGVMANADYVITSASFAGHTAPYTGANALQFGESTQLVLVIANQGNGSPTGTVTVTASCGAACGTPSVATVAAPAVGTPVTVTIPISIDQPMGSYTGTATLTTSISGAVTGPVFTLPFDVVDFTISPVTMTPSQNLPIGGTGIISVSVATQVPSGSPFGIAITPTPSSTVTFTPSTQTAAGANVAFTANIGGGTSPTASTTSPDMITVSATNYGVTKTASIPVNYFTAQFQTQNLFVNDAGNPLTLPVATSAGAPLNYPTVNLVMAGNYIGGMAPLAIANPTCGSFTDPLSITSAQPGDPATLRIYANVGNTCPAGSVVTIQAAIPNTNPATTQAVYKLYVAPKGLAQLQVVSATPSRDLTTQPWLAGEPMDWTVVVKNAGSGPSTGNEPVMLALNGAQIGTGTLSSIAPNATGQIVIHTDAPDFPSSMSGASTGTLYTHVVLDSQGDLAPGRGDLYTSVNIANWGINVNGAGSSDSSPAQLVVGGSAATANVVVTALSGGTFNPNLTLPMVLGSYSSNQLNPSTFSPSTVSAAAGTTVTMSIQNGVTPLSGAYFVQVIAQMKDGGNVTAQRQATIHVAVSNPSGSTPATIVLASDQNNIGSCPNGTGGGCGTPSNTVQINGPLPASVTLTATVSYCSAGPCTGNVDVSFTDGTNTTTTPPASTIAVTSPGNTLPIRVKAATNPDGSVNPGAATVYASVTGIQAPFAGARQPNPDPVGNNQFAMAFNVGDIYVSSAACVGVQPGSPSAVPLTISWTPISGFNVPSISWEWEDSNHLLVGSSPLSFSSASGTSTYSSGSYTALPTFNLTNTNATGLDGVQTYYFAVTVSNGLATATKYFPFTFDLSQAQTFCPALGGARGGAGGQLIRGSWGRAGLIAAASRPAVRIAAMADLRLNASDISFTPSMPKTGDTVSVRFHVTNAGDANATAVPIALQVNGETVASDTFDVPAGKTVLAGLQWNNAQIPSASTVSLGRATRRELGRPSRGGPVPIAAPSTNSVLMSLNAMLVIDPQQKTRQKTTMAKSVALSHFTLHEGTAASMLAGASISRQRVVLELGDGGCAGLRFATGIGSCGSADVTVNVEDLAKGVYTLQADNGIADLGTADLLSTNPSVAGNYGPQAIAQSGHTYAVQLRGGSVGLFTVTAVRNPNELSEAAQKLFRGGQAGRVMSKLARSSIVQESQSAQDSRVYFDIIYQGQ